MVRAKHNSIKFLEYLCVMVQDVGKETDNNCTTAGVISLFVQPFLTLLSHLKGKHNYYAWELIIEFKLPLIKHSNQISTRTII